MIKKENKKEVSAGGVVCMIINDQPHVCIVNTHDGADWQFPKGHLDPGETLEQAAVREVREESGIDAHIIKFITETFYVIKRKNRDIDKTVYFYLMASDGGNLKDHDDEVLEARWVDTETAAAMLTYPTEQDVLKQAILLIDKLKNEKK